MRVLEVRCCCDPGKLLGWLAIPTDLARPGVVLKYMLPFDRQAWQASLRDGTFESWPTFESTREVVTLTVDEWIPTMFSGAELAVRSNDTPIEKLRRVTTFLEVPALPSRAQQYRKDGWPFCPACGEDELMSLDVHRFEEGHLIMATLPRPTDRLRCLLCGWLGHVPPAV